MSDKNAAERAVLTKCVGCGTARPSWNRSSELWEETPVGWMCPACKWCAGLPIKKSEGWYLQVAVTCYLKLVDAEARSHCPCPGCRLLYKLEQQYIADEAARQRKERNAAILTAALAKVRRRSKRFQRAKRMPEVKP